MGLLLGSIAAGLVLLPLLTYLPPVWPLALAATAAGLWGWRRRAFALLCLAAFLAAAAWSIAGAWRGIDGRIPPHWEEGRVQAEGYVEGLPDPAERGGFRIRFRPARVEVDGVGQAVRDDARWLLYGTFVQRPGPGDRCRLSARLKRPHGAANPGGFDYEAWLLAEGISATGSARDIDCTPASGTSVDMLRLALRDRIASSFEARPAGGVLLALVSGDRALVPDAAWEIYTATGIVHLMAISGLHVTLLSLAVFWAVRRALRSWPGLGLRIPLHKPALVVSFMTGVAYSLFAGYSIPTERTLIMLAVVVACSLAERRLPAVQVLLLALVAVLVWSPLAVHAPGFWLSFGAVALLIVLGNAVRDLPSWRQALQVQFALSLLLLPLTLWFFERASWVSPFANLLAVPLVTLAIVPLGLAGAVAWLAGAGSAAEFCWSASIRLLEWLDVAMAWFASLPAASLAFSLPGAAGLLCLLLALGCLLQPVSGGLRLLAPLFLLPLLLPFDDRVPGQLRLTVFDVGQGLSVLVETERHRLLYDAGPAPVPQADAGRRYILPSLSRRGVRALDMLVLSHSDNDHTGGAGAVLQGVVVAQGLGALPAARDDLPLPFWQACRAGQRWWWDGWEFAILYPDAEQRRYARSDNNRSCVLRISRGAAAVLLPGDLERIGELSLLDRHDGAALASTVLVLGHHGSRSSTSAELLEAVRPSLGLVSAGYRNAFRHPSPQVLERLEVAGIPWLGTAGSGAITVVLEPSGKWRASEFRRDAARYWQRARPTPFFADGTTISELGGGLGKPVE